MLFQKEIISFLENRTNKTNFGVWWESKQLTWKGHTCKVELRLINKESGFGHIL